MFGAGRLDLPAVAYVSGDQFGQAGEYRARAAATAAGDQDERGGDPVAHGVVEFVGEQA
ncbi:hypothetical protein [Spongiactinospora sp. 9N601]|uniref:hypothetical protein n=1 Tax=Spongiactinospora sp. 9N601 TaxID=3375149 RepID=UPI0037A59DD3